LYRQIAEGQGLDVVVVRAGEEAGRVLQTRSVPALLITDLSLPGRGGLALISDLRRLAPPERSAVLVLSASSALRDRAQDLQRTLGISEIADKNLSADALRQAVVRALDGLGRSAPPIQLASDGIEELLRKVLYRTAHTFHVPIALVSLDLGPGRWFTMYVDVSEPPSDELDTSWPWSMLQRIGNTREPFIVPDIAAYAPFGLSSLIGPTLIRGLVIVPLLTSAGRVTGALSLLDLKPLTLGAEQIDLFVDLGRRLADEFAKRPAPGPVMTAGLGQHQEEEDRWQALRRLALTDALTGLSNRRAGEQALAREVARARRHSSHLCLVLLDLDHFKKVNDLLGHASGDQVLVEVSRALRGSFRASDLVVRWGGDEFLVLLPDVTLKSTLAFTHRIRTHVEALFLPGIGQLTLSAGVVEVGQDENAEAALRRADARLYEAKAAGRNRVQG
jgi:diguanylate cyclase (GGDEF)-like protein